MAGPAAALTDFTHGERREMRTLKNIFGAALCGLVLAGCTQMKIAEFSGRDPTFILEQYFEGYTKAYGMFEGRFSGIPRQFVVDITGEWQGDVFVLDEKFRFDDGERSERTWRIRKTGPGAYEGQANDVIGIATGMSAGNAFNWRYVLELKVSENWSVNVSFDDWMLLNADGVLLNRAVMSKLGVDLGTVTIAFLKNPGDVPPRLGTLESGPVTTGSSRPSLF
jgi:hypothetical protein